MLILVYSDSNNNVGMLRADTDDLNIALTEFAGYFDFIKEGEAYKTKELLELFRKNDKKGPEHFHVVITARGSVVPLGKKFLGVEDFWLN